MKIIYTYIIPNAPFVFLAFTLYFYIRAMILFPPRMHFMSRIDIEAMEEDKKAKLKKGEKYYIKLGISLLLFIISFFVAGSMSV